MIQALHRPFPITQRSFDELKVFKSTLSLTKPTPRGRRTVQKKAMRKTGEHTRAKR